MWFDIFSFMFSLTVFAAAWTFGFFVFDEAVLNGYFKKKLQRRFNIDDIK